MMVKRKQDGAVDESSADREIRKSDAIVTLTVKNLKACTKQNRVLRQAGSMLDEI